jgi:hypothetical protein
MVVFMAKIDFTTIDLTTVIVETETTTEELLITIHIEEQILHELETALLIVVEEIVLLEILQAQQEGEVLLHHQLEGAPQQQDVIHLAHPQDVVLEQAETIAPAPTETAVLQEEIQTQLKELLHQQEEKQTQQKEALKKEALQAHQTTPEGLHLLPVAEVLLPEVHQEQTDQAHPLEVHPLEVHPLEEETKITFI